VNVVDVPAFMEDDAGAVMVTLETLFKLEELGVALIVRALVPVLLMV
jgi:hypothetical protein